jgi:hypothetical protein
VFGGEAPRLFSVDGNTNAFDKVWAPEVRCFAGDLLEKGFYWVMVMVSFSAEAKDWR